VTDLAAIEAAIDAVPDAPADPVAAAAALLATGERVLEAWLARHGQVPGEERREGFRLLALHRQGARLDPSFNACRETCRELAYHYNLIVLEPDPAGTTRRLAMMRFVARHLCLFVSGKLVQHALGDFCCSARPLREREA
jgi:hypothetical protein